MLNWRDLGKRLKNYGTIYAIGAWIISVLEMTQVISLTPEEYDLFFVGGLNILVLLGFVNNPTNGKGLKDEE